MNDFDLAQSICDGTFDVLCPKMQLVRCPEYHEVVATGCGRIWADDDGRLFFRMATERLACLSKILHAHRPPGEMYEVDEYVALKASDANGREWSTNRLLIHLDRPSEVMNGEIEREIESMTFVRKRQWLKENSLRMYVPQLPPIPFDQSTQYERKAGQKTIEQGWAIDHHNRKIGDADVEFRKLSDGWLVVRAEKDSSILRHWPGLLCQAIGFATVRDVRPALIATAVDDTELVGVFAGPFKHSGSSMPRPHTGLLSEDAKDFWDLVEKLFLYLWQLDDVEPALIHDLAAIRAGARMSFSAACLTLAVGVEAIARQVLPEVAPHDWDARALAELQAYVHAWSGHMATRDRALGLLRSRSEPRVTDALYAWAKSNGGRDVLVNAWKSLRHPVAHGKLPGETQPKYDAYHATVELLYRIVATAIGYIGHITETSQRDWGLEPNIHWNESVAETLRSIGARVGATASGAEAE